MKGPTVYLTAQGCSVDSDANFAAHASTSVIRLSRLSIHAFSVNESINLGIGRSRSTIERIVSGGSNSICGVRLGCVSLTQ